MDKYSMYVPVYTFITYVRIMISEYHSFLSTVSTIITTNKWDVINVITDAMIMYWFRDIMFEQVYDKYLWNDLARNVTKLQHLKMH